MLSFQSPSAGLSIEWFVARVLDEQASRAGGVLKGLLAGRTFLRRLVNPAYFRT